MRSAFTLWVTVAAAAGCATDGDRGWRTLPPGPPAVVSLDPPRGPVSAPPAAAPSVAPAGPPYFATAGFEKPRLKVKHCVEDGVVMPEQLSGYESGPVVVKFAVLTSGVPAQYSVITSGVPNSIQEAIWSAIQACEWHPGADPQGRPADIWVILPLRFTASED